MNTGRLLSGYRREYYGGALMVLIGAGAAVQGLSYRVGTLTQMESGFFPVALGIILVLLGIMIAGTARRAPARAIAKHSRPEWRGWICILSSVAAFAILGRWGGLLPATFAITFISAIGDRENSWRAALVLALVICTISVVIFWWALQLQLPLFAWG